MIHIQSPGEFGNWSRKTIFLAGGITGCPNWQADMVVNLRDSLYVLYNPRREDFDVTDKSMESAQIEWEHHYLREADIILFWFPKETLCPITLFELGCFLNTPKTLLIGVEPGYARERDVRIQTKLARPNEIIFSHLDSMADQLL